MIRALLLMLLLASYVAAATPTDNFYFGRPDDSNRTIWGSTYRSAMATIDEYLPAVRLDQTTSAEITVGEIVQVLAAGTLQEADASLVADASVLGVCVQEDDATCLVQTSGITPSGTFSSLTTGSDYYLSETAGGVTATAPSPPALVRLIGTAISATQIALKIGQTDAHAALHEDGGPDEIDGDVLAVSWAPTYYTRDSSTPSEADSTDDLTAHLQGIDSALARVAWTSLRLDDTYEDTDADHALGGSGAPIGADTNNAGVRSVAYDASTTEARILPPLVVPSLAAGLQVRTVGHASTTPAGAVVVRLGLRCRNLENGAAVGSWLGDPNAALLNDVDLSTNEYNVVDTHTAETLASLGCTAGEPCQCALTREAGDSTDTLVGDFELVALEYRWVE